MIRIAVCDDNEIILKKLVSLIDKEFNKYTNDIIVKHFYSGILLLTEHDAQPFDILFLDIDMPKISGFDIAKVLRNNFSNCFIIFVTSHSELVYESMDFQPFHFIRKNCEISLENSISEIASKLMRHMKQNEKIILEDDISGRKAVFIRDIIYMESDRHYVRFYIMRNSEPIKMRMNISECEEKFQEYDFVRIHRKYCVNMRFLTCFDNKNDEITLKADEHKYRLPMSKKLKNAVDEKYTLYLRSKI